MAGGWVKSLQCKSRAIEDVYHPSTKTLIPTTGCRNSVQNIKDVVHTTKKPKPKPKPNKPSPPPLHKYPSSRCPSTTTKPEFQILKTVTVNINRSRSATATVSHRGPTTVNPRFPSLTELTEGHPSRNVVEIIFHTSWGPKPFSGRVEMIFKVNNSPQTVLRFEDYREAVKNRSASGSPTRKSNGEENARCVADGNEVMRFHCLGPTSGGGPYSGACALSFHGVKGSAICTFTGSSGAHKSSGGGSGRRAMLVCRVIAGPGIKAARVHGVVVGGANRVRLGEWGQGRVASV